MSNKYLVAVLNRDHTLQTREGNPSNFKPKLVSPFGESPTVVFVFQIL